MKDRKLKVQEIKLKAFFVIIQYAVENNVR